MTRLRRDGIVLALVILSLVAAACGGADGGPSTSESDAASTAPSTTAVDLEAIRPVTTGATPRLPVTVTGSDGVKVTVTSTERIVVLEGGVAEIVWSLGLGGSVIGRDVSTTFAEASDVPVVTKGHSVSAEGILSLRPTLVLADPRTRPIIALDQIREAGVPLVVAPRALTLDEVPGRIRGVAEAIGLTAEGEALVTRTQAEIDSVRREQPDGTPLRVAFVYLRGSAGVYLLGGRGSGVDQLIEAVGAIDVGSEAGLGDFTPLTAEALVTAEPDVLLVMGDGLQSVGGEDGLLEVAGVAQTPAGRDRRFAIVDDGLLYSFGPRMAATLQVLAAQLDAA